MLSYACLDDFLSKNLYDYQIFINSIPFDKSKQSKKRAFQSPGGLSFLREIENNSAQGHNSTVISVIFRCGGPRE